jgi:proline iminopeptidase
MSTTSVNGFDLYYEEAGSGPACVVLHGGLGFDHHYMTALSPLESALRMIYVDQRGNGRSGRPPIETITIPQLAADVDAFREALGLEKVAVMGHSYGGFVALEYATRYPDRASHVIALSTSPGVFEPTDEELSERADPSWITPEVQAGLDFFAQGPPESYAAFIDGVPLITKAWLRTASPDVLAQTLLGGVHSVDAMRRGFEVLAGWSVADKLDRIACPTLAVCGRCDLFTTPECSARIANGVPGAEVVWLDRSGHFPWVDEPDVFFAAVLGWLGRNGAPGS